MVSPQDQQNVQNFLTQLGNLEARVASVVKTNEEIVDTNKKAPMYLKMSLMSRTGPCLCFVVMHVVQPCTKKEHRLTLESSTVSLGRRPPAGRRGSAAGGRRAWLEKSILGGGGGGGFSRRCLFEEIIDMSSHKNCILDP